MSPILLALIALPVLLYLGGKETERNRAQIKEMEDLQLTGEINLAAWKAGLNPAVEMQRMSESMVYPIVWRRDDIGGSQHNDRCECATCQQAWPQRERSRIIDGIAHAHACECDECRVCVAIILGCIDGAKIRARNGKL